MEFQGFVKIDQHLVDTLGPYLEDKETEFGRVIVDAIDKIMPEFYPLPEPPESGYKIKLFEAVEIFGKRIQQLSLTNHLQRDVWQKAADEINAAAWHYLEFLEGSTSELFKHLKTTSLTQWNHELSQSVDAIKIMVMHHLEDFDWALRRLEKQLWKLRWESEKSSGLSTWFQKIVSFGDKILDRSLFFQTKKAEKYLVFQYSNFANRYGLYRDLYSQMMEKNTHELDGFEGLNSFEGVEKLKYKKLYDFLEIWEINQQAKAVPSSEVILTLNRLITSEDAKKLFKDYFQVLFEKLFEYSRSLKTEERQSIDIAQKYSKEALSLANTIVNYREFLLSTNPNFGARSRWRLSKWIGGPETKSTKELLDLSYDVEELKGLYDDLVANDREPTPNFEKTRQEINRLLHSMGLPLISRATTKTVSEKVLEQIKGLDELGTTNPAVVELVGQTLRKLLKVDWKYNVLFDIPDFHQIYLQHCAIAGHSGDERQHINRLNKLKRMTQEILDWVKTGTASKYVQKFELDLNDIKGCLQDFLAYIQRIGSEEKSNSEQLLNWISKMERELLEYRYLFGKFFHDLQLIEPDERLTRSKFLFVNRYFEAIENLLSEIRERPILESQMPAEEGEIEEE